MASVVVCCPDTNIRLSSGRLEERGTGGGKTALLQLAGAWARHGHRVTVAGVSVEESRGRRLRFSSFEGAAGDYDVCVYVTGSLRHFDVPGMGAIRGRVSILWINGPLQIRPPDGGVDHYVAPARFMARRAIDQWGFPAERVVVIPGESVRARRRLPRRGRDPYRFVYASHPAKGLDNVIEVLRRVRGDHPAVGLDVYGGVSLWGDDQTAERAAELPDWVRVKGMVAQREMEALLPRYGVMPYVTGAVDGFTTVGAEAAAAGVVFLASDHGACAEFVRHGWNGLLVRVESGRPDLAQAERLVRAYLAEPAAFEPLRRRAAASVATWDEQAAQWETLFRETRAVNFRLDRVVRST